MSNNEFTYLMSNNEFTYFSDASVDRVAAFAWQLAQELHVTRARLMTLEHALVAAGVLGAASMESRKSNDLEKAELATDREEYTDHLMRILTETDDHNAPMREQFESLKNPKASRAEN